MSISIFHVLSKNRLIMSTIFQQKFIILAFLLTFVIPESLAQRHQTQHLALDTVAYHSKGDQNINIGIGLINPSGFAFNLVGGGSGAGNPSPSFNLSYEYGLTQAISIGAFFNYYRVDAQNDYTIDDITDIVNDPLCALQCNSPFPIPGAEDCICEGGTIKERNNVFTFGGKLSYHIYKLEKLDTYASTYLGYSLNRRKTITESAVSSLLNGFDSKVNIPTIVYFVSAGARYYIIPQIALFGEFGYGNTHLLQLGFTYRPGY